MAGNAEDMITLTSAEQDLGGSNLSGATAPDAEDLVITNNTALGIYEAAIGGRTAAGLVYNKVGSRVILLATSVLPEFRGKGSSRQAHRRRPRRAAHARKDRHRHVSVRGSIRQCSSGICRRSRAPWSPTSSHLSQVLMTT
jgi:hypothetical protein